METPEFFRGTGVGSFHYNNSPFNNNSDRRYSDTMKNCDHFIVDELLDYPNDDVMVPENFGGIIDTNTVNVTGGTSTDSSVVTVVDTSCNSSYAGSTTDPSSSFFPVGGSDMGCRNYTDGQFSTELCVPYDDMAELEWLSNFVEESFSSEDLQKMQLISGMKAQTHNVISQNHQFQPEPIRAKPCTIYRPEMSVPAKARSKRSRGPTCNWTSRLLAASQTSPVPSTAIVNPAMSSYSESDVVGKKAMSQKMKETYENGSNGEGRKCFHCATDKTPQWRTGPMGPKTLCNACGVRYKSGRLVPEYRPAASPTFMLTKHSNSHRKVIELRRQNEFFQAQQQQQQQQFLHDNMMFDVSNGGDDFLIHHHHHLGTDYGQQII